MRAPTKSFFYTAGRNQKPPYQVFLRYMTLETIQCYRKKKKLIELLELLEEDHDLPGLKEERDKEQILIAAKKIIEKNQAP